MLLPNLDTLLTQPNLDTLHTLRYLLYMDALFNMDVMYFFTFIFILLVAADAVIHPDPDQGK